MKVLTLALFVIIGSELLDADIRTAGDVQVYNLTNAQSVNALFRTCIKECKNSGSSEERTECTVHCTRKYPLPKRKKPLPMSNIESRENSSKS